MHESPPLRPAQSAAPVLPHYLQAGGGHPQDVELVDDDRRPRELGSGRLLVRPPHVHRHQLASRSGRQALQKGDHGRAMAIPKEVEHSALPHIGQHAARGSRQVDLVDPQLLRRHHLSLDLQSRGVLAEMRRTVLSASPTSSATLTNVRRSASRWT